MCDWRNLASSLSLQWENFKSSICKICHVVTFVNRRWWTQNLQNFQQKGIYIHFFHLFSFLNGRRIMELRADIALSAWNGPSPQTNKNITLPLEKFRLFESCMNLSSEAVNEMTVLGWTFQVLVMYFKSLLDGYQLLAHLVSLLWGSFLSVTLGLYCSASVVNLLLCRLVSEL